MAAIIPETGMKILLAVHSVPGGLTLSMIAAMAPTNAMTVLPVIWKGVGRALCAPLPGRWLSGKAG